METKDWTGNGNSLFKCLGASNHTDKERERNDYYATDPVAIDKLLTVFNMPKDTRIWEPCCGEGHLASRLEARGYSVYASDLIDRGYGEGGIDFLKVERTVCNCILTNPPYKYALEMVLHSLNILPKGGLCLMFLKTTFLEGKKRKQQLFDKYPPKYVFQFSERVLCAKNGRFEEMIAGGGSAVAYAWFVWEKGYNGDTIIKWI